jgi:uncharacterized membrane protein
MIDETNKTYTVTVGHKNVEVEAVSSIEAATKAVEQLREEDDFYIGFIIKVADTQLLELNKKLGEQEALYFLSSYILSNASMHNEARFFEDAAKSLDDSL